MVSNLLVVAGQVLTLFLMMGVGFFLVRRDRLNAAGLSQLSYILLYVVTPCLMVDALGKAACTPALLRELAVCLAVVSVLYAVNMLLSRFLFPRAQRDTGDTLRFAAIYGNTSFMGLPLIQSILGDEALIYCTVVIAIFNIATWTHGAVVMGGRENASVRKALLNPGVLGCAAGFLLFFLDLELPAPLGSAVGYLADLNTPLAMVVIGGQMASAGLLETFRRRELYAASALKLLALPVLTALLILPLKLGGLMFCTIVILAGTPTAGITGIFAQQFRRDTAAAARMITLSTLLSILTLPVVAVAARALSGL